MYSWPDVAARTVSVYDTVASAPAAADALLPRLRRYRRVGAWAGLLFCAIAVMLRWMCVLLEWQQPSAMVEAAPDWPLPVEAAAAVAAGGGGGGGGICSSRGTSQPSVSARKCSMEQPLHMTPHTDGAVPAPRRRPYALRSTAPCM
jgi:hypothetical protein